MLPGLCWRRAWLECMAGMLRRLFLIAANAPYGGGYISVDVSASGHSLATWEFVCGCSILPLNQAEVG